MRYWSAWIADPDNPDLPGWAEGCLVVKLSAEVADLSEEMRLVLAEGVERLIARTAALIREGREDGSLPNGADAQALAQALYQMWLGAALVAKLTRTTESMNRALSATEQLLGCKASADDERTTS
ncbi:TetR family transcriptional regulator C-terminal domain-containing protein [Brucella rhizosphaerae]|uniref:TetR family transcriptional regulator C-terminal domain-containing protein n=1 Tax=Brucella rhizosphaerae TaxID=571254 RepID=UPI000466167F|nr:TetR family transcriptional regulator C-terminal domain-containing protein [Brucella rhizosphaerae]